MLSVLDCWLVRQKVADVEKTSAQLYQNNQRGQSENPVSFSLDDFELIIKI